MNGDPVLVNPEDTVCYIALGSAGAVFQDGNNQDEVVKAPLKHDLKGCSHQVVESVRNRESYSELCISREKLIYQTLPKDPNILECLAATEKGLQFPYYRLGNIRDYLRKHNKKLVSNIQDQWIKNAIDAITLIHAHGVIHADISPRNFLVADDLSIKLCDFAGSVIGDLEPLVEEEDRYRISPWSPRNFKTDLFALGCLIYEISTGQRPYNEIDDSESKEIERRYAAQIFPSLVGLKYRDIISKCWTSRYSSADMLRTDFDRCIRGSDGLREPTRSERRIESGLFQRPFVTLAVSIASASCVIYWVYHKQNRR
jgi:serine/threonine protein kinase